MKWHMPKFRQFIALMLAVLLVGSTPVHAAQYYAPGPKKYELDRTYLVFANNAVLDGDNLVFEAGGSMCFDFPMPFDSERLVLVYEGVAEATQLTIQTDKNSYSCQLEPETTTHEVGITEAFGSKTFTITTDKALTLNSIKFHKIMEMPVNVFESTPIELNEYDEALCAAVIIKNNASAIKSRGAIRRLDVTDPTVTPQNINGSMYVPLDVLAIELKLYCEDYADKSYVLLRDDKLELALIGGKGYLTDISGAKTEVEVNLFYRDGVTWGPVRQIAELFGHHVEYRDGCAVIDDRLWAKRIINDEKIFAQLQNELLEYIPSPVAGKTYHVAQSASASDANSGTEQYPFATLEKAAAVAQAGDTVVIHEGTYRETLRPLNNGTKSSPIIFRSAEGENVIISALEPVTQFVKYDENIYCAALPKDLGDGRNQLFYKGEGLEEGRHPDSNTKPGAYPLPECIPDKYWATKGNISIKVKEGNIATSDTDLDQPDDYWKGGVFVTMKGEAWSLVSGDIISSTAGELKVKDHDGVVSYSLGISQGSWFNLVYGNTTTKYYKNVHPEYDWGYITNHLNTVNLPGEWYIGDNRIYVYPPDGADLSSDFEVKQRQLTVDLRDRKYITIEGINTLGGGMTMAGETEGNVLNGGSHRYISHYTLCTDNQGGYINEGDSRLTIGAPHAGEVGLFMGGDNNTIMNTKIEWSAAAGIISKGRYHLVANNLVENTSYMGSYASGIAFSNEVSEIGIKSIGGHTVVKNTSRNAGRAVFQYSFAGMPGATDATSSPSLASEIAYNDFSYGGVLTRDTGITYEYSTYHGNDRIRTTMHHNYVHDLGYWDEPTKNHLFLIYHDGYVAGRETYNNITFKSDYLALHRNGVFEQTQTRVRMWQNSDLGYFPEGLDGLTESYFPNGRPFYAGCDHDGNERYMVNYNNLMVQKEIVHSPDATAMNEGKPVYTFNDVHIPADNYSGLVLYYKRPTDARMDFSIKVDVTGEEHSYTNTIPVGNSNKYWYIDTSSENYIFLPVMSDGEYDINIEFSDEDSEFYGISVFEAGDRFADMVNPNVLYCGTYDDWIPGENHGGVLGKSAHHGLEKYAFGTWLNIWNTWNHTVVYNDRTVTKPANAIEICYGTDARYSGQTLKIYVDSLDSEPIAETVLTENDWMPKTEIVELKRQLQPGTYKFYLKFEYPDGKTACTNFYYVKFLENIPQEVAE